MLTRSYSLIDESVAIFSDCERFRYRLWRIWDHSLPAICFLMLNPSTADELANDPTVARCQKRAMAMGYGRLDVVNLFALRSTDPAGLYREPEPVGADNDAAILDACRNAAMVICAWGEHGSHGGRAVAVRQMLAQAGIPLFALAVNDSGEPKHPLYVAYSVQPTPYPAC